MERAEREAERETSESGDRKNRLGQTMKTEWLMMSAWYLPQFEAIEFEEVYSSTQLWAGRSDEELKEIYFPEGDMDKEDCPTELFYNPVLDELLPRRFEESEEE